MSKKHKHAKKSGSKSSSKAKAKQQKKHEKKGKPSLSLKSVKLAKPATPTKMGAGKTATNKKKGSGKTPGKTPAKSSSKPAAAKKSGKGPRRAAAKSANTKTPSANSNTKNRHAEALRKGAPSRDKLASRHTVVPADTKPTRATSEAATRKSIHDQKLEDLRKVIEYLTQLPEDSKEVQLFRAFAFDILRISGDVQIGARVMPHDDAVSEDIYAPDEVQLGARVALLDAQLLDNPYWSVAVSGTEDHGLRTAIRANRKTAQEMRAACKEVAVARNQLQFAISRQLSDSVRGVAATPAEQEQLANKTTAAVTSYKSKLKRLVPLTKHNSTYPQRDISFVVRHIDTRVSR